MKLHRFRVTLDVKKVARAAGTEPTALLAEKESEATISALNQTDAVNFAIAHAVRDGFKVLGLVEVARVDLDAPVYFFTPRAA